MKHVPRKLSKLRRRQRQVSLGMFRAHLARVTQDTYATVLASHGYREDFITDNDDDAVTSVQTSPSSEGTYHDLSNAIARARNSSAFYPHNSTLLGEWEHGPSLSLRDTGSHMGSCSSTDSSCSSTHVTTAIAITSSAVLKAARKAWNSSIPIQHNEYGLGVLNSASPKKPGGASLNGGATLEECIVRQSTLIDSLQNSLAALEFYAAHRKFSDGSGLHDHAMLYNPNIIVFKDERGRKVSPITVNVVSAVPVHAGTVRYKKYGSNDEDVREEIRRVMRQRMARILRLFEERGDRVLVLGAFGIGQFSNCPEMVGELWAELLCVRDAKYRGVFDKVIFSVPSKYLPAFRNAFDAKVLESELIWEFEELESDSASASSQSPGPYTNLG